MRREQGDYTRRPERRAEVRGFHGRPSYRISTTGCSALEPRHHHAARTRRQRKYAVSGRLTVIVVLMAPPLRTRHASRVALSLGHTPYE